MADKKLNEVTKVTDMAYVPVIMADGSVGQISKADLASVVAELTHTDGIFKVKQTLNPSQSMPISYEGHGGLMIIRTGFNPTIGLYVLNYSEGFSAVQEAPGIGSLFTIEAGPGLVTITNTHTGAVGISVRIIALD